MKVEPRADLGILVSDFKVQEATAAEAKLIVELVHTHKLVVLTGQNFDEREYVNFGRLLGRPQVYLQANYHHPDWPEIFVSSSVQRDGKKFGVKGTGRYWHTDYAFMPEPLPLTMVTPRIIPKQSRGTLYIDMEAAYRRLPGRLRHFVDTHDGIHEGKWRYKVQPSDVDRSLADILADCERGAPAVHHPAVIDHPLRGTKALYLSSGFTTGFVGTSVEEGKRYLDEILSLVESDANVVQKPWCEGEVLIWDNRSLIHKAAHADVEEANLSYRIGIYDGLPFYQRSTTKVRKEGRDEQRIVTP
jgi:taurine dioxygenase